MNKTITALLIVIGLINFFPVLGILSAEALASAYSIPVLEGDLLILMRHRALLFGVVGSLILVSAFRRELQPAAMTAAFVSMAGFIVLTLTSGDYGDQVFNIMLVDVLGVVLLAAVTLLYYRRRQRS